MEALATQPELARYEQWVCWRREGNAKVPFSPTTGGKASTTDSRTWGTYEEAVTAEGDYEGIGFVVSKGDPYTFVDLDDCISAGEVMPWALEVVEWLNSYTEVTPSGEGLRIWVEAHKPGTRCRVGSIEVYDSGQFSTFTGRRFSGEGIEMRQKELSLFYLDTFGGTEPSVEDEHGLGSGGFVGTDAELLEKIRGNQSHGDTFTRLYDRGHIGGFHSQSEADLRLCTILAYWCGPDVNRIDGLFRTSNLMRPKWDTGRGSSTYGEQTIERGIRGCSYFYDPDYTRKSGERARDELRGLSEWLLSQPWKGRSGPTDRDVLKALIRHAWKYGRVHPDGIEVAMSERDAGLESGTSQAKTVRRAFERLEDKHGVIERLDNGGPRKASRFVLKRYEPTPYIQRVYKYGVSLQRKLRYPSQYVATIGKRNGQILDFVHSFGKAVSLDEIALHLQVKQRRILKHRNIKLLLEEGFLIERDGGYATPQDIEMRMARFLRESGHDEAERLQRERVEREREAFRTRHELSPQQTEEDEPRVHPEVEQPSDDDWADVIEMWEESAA